MNKKDRLLAEILGDADGESFARMAAAHARRRRVVKQCGLAVATMMAAVAAMLVFRQPPPQPAPVPHVSASTSMLEIISDEELLVQLHDQPVLLLRDKSGITGVVFLADNSR